MMRAEALLLLLLLATGLATAEQPWAEGADAIAAAAPDRPIAILLSIPSCRWCDRMLAESAADPDTSHLLARVAAIHIDCEAEPALAAQLGVTGFPTLVLANRRRRIVRLIPGYLPPADLATALRVLIQHGDGSAGLGELDAAGAAEAERAARGPDAARALATLLGRGPATRRAAARRLLARSAANAATIWPLLDSEDLAVRVDAAAVLADLTGASPGYDPFAPAAERRQAAAAWRSQGSGVLP